MLAKIRGSIKEKLQDPYLLTKAYSEPTICPVCGLVYHKKRWTRDERLMERVADTAKRAKCPSCRKIEDHYPMGIVILKGDFLKNHKEEIINRIKNTEKREILRNPLDRIMSLKEIKGDMVIETTSENLAIALGKALRRSYKGELEIRFSEDQKMVRVFWQRNFLTKKEEI